MIVLGRKPGGGGSGPGGGVTSVAKQGDAGLTGAVTFSEGANVTLTQVGQDIEVASSGGGSPSVVTSLPGSPSDGDEVYLKVGSGDTAVLWHLRYDSAITDSYKWRFLGGAPLWASLDTSANTNSGSFVGLNSNTPTLTLPTIGVYDFHHGARTTGTGIWSIIGLNINDASPPSDDVQGVAYARDDNGSAQSFNWDVRYRTTVSSISTSAAVYQVYRTDGGTYAFLLRWIFAIPVRLG